MVQIDQVFDFSLRITNIHHNFVYRVAEATILAHESKYVTKYQMGNLTVLKLFAEWLHLI